MLPYVAVPTRVMLDPALTAHGLRCYILLASYANEDGWCWPSLRTLATHLGVSRQAVHQHVDHLVALGHVQRARMALPTGKTVTAYRPLLDLTHKAARAKLEGKLRKTVKRGLTQPSSLAERPVKSRLTMEVDTLKKKGDDKKNRTTEPPVDWLKVKDQLLKQGLCGQPADTEKTGVNSASS